MFHPSKLRLNHFHLQSTAALTTRTKPSGRKPMVARSTARAGTEYKPVKVLGKGAFGVVYCARSPNGTLVAIKKVLQDPHYKNRELDILKLLRNKYCISLKNSFKTSGKTPREVYLNIVMDYLPTSLHQFVMGYRQSRKFPPIFYVRLFAFQLFAGLAYLHSEGITHRDIKPENVLVDPETGGLKICDFGSAKMLRQDESSVAYIASRYYRAPELVLGCTHYTSAIDIWAAGCVVAEMLTSGMPLFVGNSSIGQLTAIVKVLGPPSREDLGSFEWDRSIRITGQKTTTLAAALPKHTPADLLNLLSMIFVYDPAKRPTAQQILGHPCFDELFDPSKKLPNGRKIPIKDRSMADE